MPIAIEQSFKFVPCRAAFLPVRRGGTSFHQPFHRPAEFLLLMSAIHGGGMYEPGARRGRTQPPGGHSSFSLGSDGPGAAVPNRAQPPGGHSSFSFGGDNSGALPPRSRDHRMGQQGGYYPSVGSMDKENAPSATPRPPPLPLHKLPTARPGYQEPMQHQGDAHVPCGPSPHISPSSAPA